MNISASMPHQHSLISSYGMGEKPLDEKAVENEGSVLKPVEEVRSANRSNAVGEDREAVADKQMQQQASQEQNDGANKLEARQERIEQQQIQELSARDREVRNHERAHAAVGGLYAGAPRYQYERGPDGVNYAVAGEVSISTGAVNGDPEATIEKAQIVRRAALAPAEPSAQDRRVAAQATQMEAEARVELANLQREERLDNDRAEAEKPVDKEQNSVVAQQSADEKTFSEETNEERRQELIEQQQAYSRLANDLGKRLIDSSIESQAPRPGQIVSRFA